MTSFSPVHTIGFQIAEVLRIHKKISKREALDYSCELLDQVGIPKPKERLDAYAFQLSGGMRQRAMIAMALACSPKLLIADEPTTALDVTTQAQIMDLLHKLQADYGMAMILITHNLGLVAEMCSEVVVMYLGEVVERSPVIRLFNDALHPYTQALLRSIPRLELDTDTPLEVIEGSVPDPYNRPTGCPFHPRCARRIAGKCDQVHPDLTIQPDGRAVRCFLYEGNA